MMKDIQFTLNCIEAIQVVQVAFLAWIVVLIPRRRR